MSIEAVVGVLGIILMGTGLVDNLYPPLGRAWRQSMNRTWANELYPFAEAINLYRREKITDEDFTKFARKHGLNKESLNQLLVATEEITNANELYVLYMRKEIEQEEYFKRMSYIGYDQQTSERFTKAREYYPGAGDLITFQAKEVFEKEMVKKYGLLDEFENIDLEPFRKANMPDEITKQYWIAHWEHPSWYQIRDMLHKELVTEEIVYEWFKLIEIPPYWRSRLTAILYEPYTRVDARRLYSEGLITEEEVYTNYRHLGYNHEKATKLVQFAKIDALPAERDLTKSMIVTAFNQHEIDREFALEYLQKLRYDEREANLILTLEENEVENKDKTEHIKTLKNLFALGIITFQELSNEFDLLGLHNLYKTRLMSEAMRQQQQNLKNPSLADLSRWIKKKLITKEQYVMYMEKLGFQETEIKIYLKELGK